MSTLKKALSVVLALVMLVGTISCLSGVFTIAPVASAAGTSNVKTVAELDTKYAGYLYAYYATDIYETNDKGQLELTDFYVEAGDKLTIREFLKTNYYVGIAALTSFFSRDFFETSDTGVAHKFGDAGTGTSINTNHPTVSGREMAAAASYLVTDNASSYTIFTNQNSAGGYCAMDTEWLATQNYTTFKFSYNSATGSQCDVYRSNEWVVSWTLTVKDTVSDGDKGTVGVNEKAFKSSHIGQATSRAPANIPYCQTSTTGAGVGKNMHLIQSVWQDVNGNAIAGDRYIKFDYADFGGTFTVGQPKGNDVTVSDGENALFTGELLPGATLKLDTIPAKDNYVLVGLNDGTKTYPVDAATGEVQGFTMGTEPVTFTVVFEGKPVTAVFNYNDGATANFTTTIKYNDVVADDASYPEDPTRDNYTFAGWAVNGTVIDETFTMPATTTTFVAQWTADEADYTVNYYTMGEDGEYGEPETEVLSAGIGTTVTAVTAAPEGYFVDNALSTLSGTVAADNSLVLNVYYALAQLPVYTITFDADGGSAVDAISAESGTLVSAPTAPTLAGHEFAGWIDENGDAVVFPYELIEDVTFTATWTVNQYTITFTVDGEEYDSITDDFGADVTAPEDPTKTGYVFTEWYPAVPATMPAEDLEIEAQFTVGKFDAVFYVDEDIYETVRNVEFNTEITAPTDPTKTGYSFIGWEPEVDVMDEEGKEFNAVFEINQYTVSFNTDGGNETIASQTLDYGSAVEEPEEPTKTGYTFAGWTLQNNPVDLATFTVPANNVTLKAAWTANTYTASFYADKDATEALFTATVAYGSLLTLTDEQVALVTKEGYAFDAWFDKATGAAPADANGSSVNRPLGRTAYATDGDRSFYATWTETSFVTFMYKDYTTGEWKSFDKYEGKVGSTLNLGTYANKVTSALVGAEIAGSTLYDWYTDEALTNKAYNKADTITLTQADLTLYCKTIVKATTNIYDSVYDADADEFVKADEVLATKNGNEGQNMNVDVKLYSETTGYMVADLVDANGNSVVTNKNISNAIDEENATIKFYFAAQGGAQDYTVVYAPITYKLTFTGTTANAQVFTAAFGDDMPEVVAPEIDGDGAEYRNPGYTFAGWKSAQTSTSYTALPATIDADFVAADAYIIGDGSWEITFRANWNAMTFTATFMVDGEEYETAQAKTNAALSSYAPAAPTKVGYSFSHWTPAAGFEAAGNNNMPAYDVTYEAVFSARVIRLIYLKSDDLTDISSTHNEANGKVIVTKKDDLNDAVYYDDPTTSVIYSGLSQIRWAEGYILDHFEIVADKSAKIDFVKDEATGGYATVYAEGYDAPAGEIATVYLAPVYKEYGDFWFRIYNSDGALYRTFAKDFKSTYYNTDGDKVSSKDEAVVLNTTEEINIMFGYMPEFNFDGGFNIRLDPILVRRSIFTPEGFFGIFEAIGNALGSLL